MGRADNPMGIIGAGVSRLVRSVAWQGAWCAAAGCSAGGNIGAQRGAGACVAIADGGWAIDQLVAWRLVGVRWVWQCFKLVKHNKE